MDTSKYFETESRNASIPLVNKSNKNKENALINKKKCLKIWIFLFLILITVSAIAITLSILLLQKPSKKTIHFSNGIKVSFTKESIESLFTAQPFNDTYVDYQEQVSPVMTTQDSEDIAKAEASCSQHSFCTTCLKDSGLFSCRWCPISAQCHAYASIYNPCSSSEQMTDKNKCPSDSYIGDPNNNIRLTNYNEDISLKMLQYSYLAYMDELNNPEHEPEDNDIPIPETLNLIANFSYIMGHEDDETFVFIGTDDIDKHIIVSFRGSNSATQLFEEFLNRNLAAWNLMELDGIEIWDESGIEHSIFVVQYFLSGYSGLSQRVYDTLVGLLNGNDGIKYRDYDVWFTGHSLGGALTSIAALHIWLQSQYIDEYNDWKPFLIYTFGEPRIGNPGFAQLFDTVFLDNEPHDMNAYRIVNDDDIVPHILSCDWDGTIWQRCVANEKSYYHKGYEIMYAAGEYEYNRMCIYRECLGDPVHEDWGCSNRYVTFYPSAHSQYKPVFCAGGWCQNEKGICHES